MVGVSLPPQRKDVTAAQYKVYAVLSAATIEPQNEEISFGRIVFHPSSTVPENCRIDAKANDKRLYIGFPL